MRRIQFLLVAALLTLVPAPVLAQGVAPVVPVPNRTANDNSNAPANTRYVDGAIGTRAPVANPTFSGTVVAPKIAITAPGSTGDVSGMSVIPSLAAPVGSLARLLYGPAFPGVVTAGGGIAVQENQTIIGVNTVVPGGIDANGFPTGQLGGTYEATTVSHRFFPTIVANGRHFSLTSEMEAGTADPGDKVAAYFSATTGPGNAKGASDVWALNTVTRWRPGDPDVHVQGFELDFNNDNYDPGRIPAKLKNGLGIASGGRFQPGFAINIDSTQLYNKWKRGIHIGPNAVSDVGICIMCDAAFSGTLLGQQIVDGGETVLMQRRTDAAPTGMFLRFVNAANSAQLFSVDVSGRTTVGPSSSGAQLHVSQENPPAGNFAAIGVENASKAAGIAKSVAIDAYGRDTVGTQKQGGSVRVYPDDENWVSSHVSLFARTGDALAERLRLTGTGHVLVYGGAPSLSGCGTGASVSGNDTTGEITVGSSATGCVLTFATAWATKPGCTVTAQSGARFGYGISTTALTLTNNDNLSGAAVNYVCLGR